MPPKSNDEAANQDLTVKKFSVLAKLKGRMRLRGHWPSCNVILGLAGVAVTRDEVLAQLRERIVRFAASHLGRETAEDLAQEALMLLHEKYAHLDRLEDLLPLSLQIVRYKMLSWKRKAVRHGEYTQVSIEDIPLPDLDASPADSLERREMVERLETALGQMGERCRELFRLKLEGRTFPEIQKILGVGAINTVYTWDHRCRKHLLELMGGDWETGKR